MEGGYGDPVAIPDLTSVHRFLQFGSPHGLSGQAQYVAAERSEVWVNIGYRLSAFGFLACDEPKVDGNFGFKDQWLALLWIRDNIEAFGGIWRSHYCHFILIIIVRMQGSHLTYK